MKIGRLGAEELLSYDAAHLAQWGLECIALREIAQIFAVDGLMLSGEFPEQLMLSRAWCNEILRAAKQDLPIWGCGYGAYLLTKGKPLSVLDCQGWFAPSNRESVLFLTVPLWEERFAVRFFQHVHLEQPAPNLAVLAKVKNQPVILRQGNVLACTFLPSQANDSGIYGYFAEMVGVNQR